MQHCLVVAILSLVVAPIRGHRREPFEKIAKRDNCNSCSDWKCSPNCATGGKRGWQKQFSIDETQRKLYNYPPRQRKFEDLLKRLVEDYN